MRELNLYMCEVCGTQYKDKKFAEECESFHKIPKSVTPIKYRSLKGGGKYPDYVRVEFTDGSSERYKRE